MIDIYKIGNTPEELQAAIIQLRQDFDAHNHDGTSSRNFETISVETVSARTILIKKTSFTDSSSGIWMGLVGNVMKLKLGTASAYLEWTGTALNIVGSISGSTITGGTFQTATSGQRIVIAGSDNTLRFYDATSPTAVQVIGIGSTSAVAIRLDLNATTTTGIQIVTTIASTIGFDFSNSANVASRGINVANTGATQSSTSIRVDHDGNGGEGIFVQTTSAAKGLSIDNSGTGTAILISNSGVAASLIINDTNNDGSSVDPAVDITYSRGGPGVNIEVTHNGGNPTGIRMAVTNSGGNEYAFEFAGSEVVSAAVGGTQGLKLRVLISGGVYYIPFYDA